MGFEPQLLVLIGTDFPGSCKSNYHTFMIMTVIVICIMYVVQYLSYILDENSFNLQ